MNAADALSSGSVVVVDPDEDRFQKTKEMLLQHIQSLPKGHGGMVIRRIQPLPTGYEVEVMIYHKPLSDGWKPKLVQAGFVIAILIGFLILIVELTKKLRRKQS